MSLRDIRSREAVRGMPLLEGGCSLVFCMSVGAEDSFALVKLLLSIENTVKVAIGARPLRPTVRCPAASVFSSFVSCHLFVEFPTTIR